MDDKYLKDRYLKFNREYFGNVLPDMPVVFKKLKTMAGYFYGKVRRTRFPPSVELIEGSAGIKIDNLFLREPDHIDGILLHEMIHAYFAVVGAADEQHGKRFMMKLMQLEKASGIKIPKTEKKSDLELTDPTDTIEVAVILVEDNSGRRSHAVVAPSRLKSGLDEMLSMWEDRIKYGILKSVTVWRIKTEEWTKQSLQVPIQRKALNKLSLFIFKNSSLVDDLYANGTKVAETRKREDIT